jgi:predicted nuclease of predicted toxin-antitoxin system
MKLLIDMNLSPRWVKTLTEAGIEACHWSSLGPANAPDAEIMSFARTHGYVVFTHDLDFSAILAATHEAKPSVVQIRAADIRPETTGACTDRSLAANGRTVGGRRAAHDRSGWSEIARAPAGFEVIIKGKLRRSCALSLAV